MARKKKPAPEENYERWLLPYSDMITLLLSFFIIMYALTLMEKEKAAKMMSEIGSAFGGAAPTGTPNMSNYGKKSPNPLKRTGLGIFRRGTNKKVSYIENTGTNPTVGNIMNVVGARGDTGETTFIGSDKELIDKIASLKKLAGELKDESGGGSKETLLGALEKLEKAVSEGIALNARMVDRVKAIKKIIESYGKKENVGGKNDMLVQLLEALEKGVTPSAEMAEKLAAMKKLLESFGNIDNTGGKSDFLVQLAMALDSNAEINIGQAGGNATGIGGPSTGAAMSDIMEKMQNVFGEEIAQGSMEIKISKRGVEIVLSSDIVFELGSADLAPPAMKILEKIGAILKSIQKMNFRFRVEGHTDTINVHSFLYPSNWELSCARAVSVVRYLVEEMELPAGSISAEGFGSFKPVASNDTIAGRRRNRRIEILIFDPVSPINVTREELKSARPGFFDSLRSSPAPSTAEIQTVPKPPATSEVKLGAPPDRSDDSKKSAADKKR